MRRFLTLLTFCGVAASASTGAEQPNPGAAFTTDADGLIHVASGMRCPTILPSDGTVLVRWRAGTHAPQTGVCDYVALERGEEVGRLIVIISSAPVAAGLPDKIRALMITTFASKILDGPGKSEVQPGIFQTRPNTGRFAYEFGASRLHADHLLSFKGKADEARRTTILAAIDKLSAPSSAPR